MNSKHGERNQCYYKFIIFDKFNDKNQRYREWVKYEFLVPGICCYVPRRRMVVNCFKNLEKKCYRSRKKCFLKKKFNSTKLRFD